MWYVFKKIKEMIMPKGMGTYGSNVGRPPKKATKKKKKAKKGKK
mgnify:CR=1 FL=1